MKIGFDPLMHPRDKSYAMRLAELLAHYVPEHEYVCDVHRLSECDLFHGWRPRGRTLRNGPKQVVALFDLNFLRHPQLWPLPERWRIARTNRQGCLGADCVLTVRAEYKRELMERLDLDERKIRVLPALGSLAADGGGPSCDTEAVRRKYMLPNHFLMMVGTIEPGHHQKTVVDAMIEADAPFNLVICGRRTAYADRLLAYVRENHLARKIILLYELGGDDLEAVCRMAWGLLYLPGSGASPLPVVEGLRQELPMLLSDVPLNRETAGDAALYVDPLSDAGLTEGLYRLLGDEVLRRNLSRRAAERACLFSRQTLARQLQELYATL